MLETAAACGQTLLGNMYRFLRIAEGSRPGGDFGGNSSSPARSTLPSGLSPLVGARASGDNILYINDL